MDFPGRHSLHSHHAGGHISHDGFRHRLGQFRPESLYHGVGVVCGAHRSQFPPGAADGTAALSGTHRGQPALAVPLTIDLSQAVPRITGSVVRNAENLPLAADRTSFVAKTNKAPQAGPFTLALPRDLTRSTEAGYP